MSSASLAEKVCIVTGATRGIGKGIALQLGEKGAKVYITGRTLDTPKGSEIGGSLRETANEIEARGGTCVPVQCDHTNDTDIERLFEQVKRENDGQLDILVNNAYSAVNAILSQMDKKFWEQPPTIWDDVNNVGLRNNYICAVYAARIMIPRKQGLIVNISSPGGLRYLISVAYGVGKCACDRMAADCGFELKRHNVAFVSLWSGPVGTETVIKQLEDNVSKAKHEEGSTLSSNLKAAENRLDIFEKGETTEFAGQCIAAMVTDPELMKMTGKVVMTSDLARRYDLKDAEGHASADIRQINMMLRQFGHTWMAWCIPDWVRVPKLMFGLAGNKFF